MRVIPVPCRTDNYMYLLIDDSTSPAAVAVVDPYDYTKLSAAAKEANVTIGQTLLTTHHHNDHSGGNADFVQNFPKADVYAGSDKAPGANKLLRNGDKFKVGDIEVTALHTPCHTQDHICYFVEDKKTNERGVFTGDTLFVGGNGRFFEGTPAEMLRAMNVLSELPGDTKTFVGHEYTKSNVAFAMSVDPTNEAIKKLHDFANKNEVTTGVFTIGDEKEWNVFMRVNSAAVREATGSSDQVTAMGKLRELKNNFKG
ncbi:hydroxyacylglutathione hydrolase, partial [Phenoliferia sp. Uapishka_3]